MTKRIEIELPDMLVKWIESKKIYPASKTPLRSSALYILVEAMMEEEEEALARQKEKDAPPSPFTKNPV